MGLPSVPRVPENEGGRGRPFKTTHTISLYLPEHDEQLWDDFQSAMKRDGWSTSMIIREWMRQYLKDHPLGNPQKPMEPFLSPALMCNHKFGWVKQPAPHLDLDLWRCKLCGAKEKE
jgi:hypothetical protein